MLFLILCYFLRIICLGNCENFIWKNGSSSISIDSYSDGNYLLTLFATRFIQENSRNYVLWFDYLDNKILQRNSSDCIGYHDSASQFIKSLTYFPFANDISVKRYGNGSDGWNNGYLIDINITSSEFTKINISIDANYAACNPLITVGYWSDTSNWEQGSSPTESDIVFLPLDAGIVIVDVDAVVSELHSLGGSIVLHESTCGDGWTPSPSFRKCLQFFPEPLAFSEAEKKCLSLDGSFRGLSQISSFQENQLVQNMCQDRGREIGCWIGLTDSLLQGRFLWRSNAGIADTSFQSWHRFQPDNRTTLTGGEDCAYMLPFYEDPLQQSRAQWADTWCLDKKYFTCEKAGQFVQHSLTVSGTANISNTNIIGSGSLRLESSSHFKGIIKLTLGSQLILSGESHWEAQSVVINGLASINVLGDMIVKNNSLLVFTELISAPAFNFLSDWQEYRQEQFYSDAYNAVQGRGSIHVYSSGALQLEISSTVWIDQQIIIDGTLAINGSLYLAGGGSMPKANIKLGSSSNLVLVESSIDTTQTELYELQVSSTKSIIGDYSRLAAAEQDGEMTGTFRLKFDWNGNASISACIPYNATASGLKMVLENIADIHALGGVTVTRLGDGTNYWKFGYKYQIEFDAVPVSLYQTQTAKKILDVHCQGIAGCGCTEVLSSIGLGCRGNSPSKGQNTSAVSSNQCTVKPTIAVTKFLQGGFASISSTENNSTQYGTIHVTGGTHRLSPVISASLNISAGALILASNKITVAGSLKLSNNGWLVISGNGYEGWNAANLLYSAANSKGRNSQQILYPPPVTASISSIEMDGGYIVATTAEGSNITTNSLMWKGGVISGRSKLFISEVANIESSVNSSHERQLRNMFSLIIQDTAVMNWIEGNIVFREGASIEIFGEMRAYVTKGEQIGKKDSFDSLISPPTDDSLTAKFRHQFSTYGSLDMWEKSKQYSGESWYSNPLCGSGCESGGKLVIRGEGTFSTNSRSFCIISAPLFVLGKVLVAVNASTELQGGGDSYGIVTILGSLSLSGNEFRFQAQSQTTGNGTIDVTGGSHRLPPIVAPTLRVLAGKVVNFNIVTSFLNGVVIEQEGLLQFAIIGVNASITGNLTMNGGMLLFPEVNPMPALHPAHLTGDKRYLDRGILLVEDYMHWRGGIVRGDAEVHVETGMTIGGDKKYVQALAHIINKQNAIWESGDVVSSEQGFFYNLGTLEIANADTFSSEMVYLDSFDGCCPYETHTMLIWA